MYYRKTLFNAVSDVASQLGLLSLHCGEALSKVSKLSSAGLVGDGPGLGTPVSSWWGQVSASFQWLLQRAPCGCLWSLHHTNVAPERTVLLTIKGWRLAPHFSDADDFTVETATKERKSASVCQKLNRIRSRAVPPLLRSTIPSFFPIIYRCAAAFRQFNFLYGYALSASPFSSRPLHRLALMEAALLNDVSVRRLLRFPPV